MQRTQSDKKWGDRMSKPTSAVKRKYNKMAYQRYEFSVGRNTELDHLLKKYKGNPQNNMSELIRSLLCQHFGVEPDEVYSPWRLQRIDGEWAKIFNED